jgi:cation:H+ antiporter
MVLVAMYVIKYACDSFEDASEYLGKKVYRMKPGIRGATIEAIASSLPELFTAIFLLFVFIDFDGFSAAIATVAGSAIFNAAVIPALCILAVTIKGVNGLEVPKIPLLRSSVIRDGFFFLLAEVALIYFLGSTTLAWWVGGTLMLIYAIYFSVLMKGMGGEEFDEDEDEDEDEDDDDDESGFIKQIVTFDFNGLLFKGSEFSKNSAWVVLLLATATIAAGSYILADAVVLSAQALGVPTYFTAVILGAAATSVPDTFISVGNALKGDYDDAISNAVGSNIFDVCVALGLPLLIYGLIFGDVNLAGAVHDGANVQELRIALIILTVAILSIFLSGKVLRTSEGDAQVSIGKGHGWLLLAVYGVWTTFIIGRAMEWTWLNTLLGY